MQFLDVSTPDRWGDLAQTASPDHAVADCGSEGSHLRRLEAISRLPIAAGDLVLDFGCGTGRLFDLVSVRGATYVGLDWSDEVVRLARQRRPSADFRVGDSVALFEADWLVASGPFNYAEGWAKSDTKKTMTSMCRSARKGVAVTVLRTPAVGRLSYSPEELLGYVAEVDWAEVNFDRSYLPNDLCMRMLL